MATSDLANMWMVNPTMFDPTQASNQFSNYNNQAMPYPPTYNTGAGGPVNAATGQPIPSFQQWQQQNPGGMSINATPAMPPQGQAPQLMGPGNFNALAQQSMQQAGVGGGPQGSAADPNAFAQAMYYRQMANSMLPQAVSGPSGGGMGYSTMGYTHPQTSMYWNPASAPGAASQAAQGGGGGAGGAPNNWQAAINALANPGNPVTPGATVPLQSGSQPAGGVNQAFLQQAGGGQGMNQNFLSALAAIQGRPQQGSAGGAPVPGGGGQTMGGGAPGPMWQSALGGAAPPGASGPTPTQGYLDANGAPTPALNALAQSWRQPQQQWAATQGRR